MSELDALRNITALAETMRSQLESLGHEVPNGYFNEAYKAIERGDCELLESLKGFVAAFNYDPGHSDLDNEQPIHITVNLGQWRRARSLIYRCGGKI